MRAIPLFELGCKAPCTPAADPSDIPPGFDPASMPIISRHFFGIEPFCSVGAVTAQIVQDLKYRRKIKRLVAKGERVVGEMLAELARRDLLPARNGVAPAASARPRPSPRPVEPHAPSLEIWREAIPATDDTLTARYLRGRRLGGTDRWIGFRSYDTLYLIHFPPRNQRR